MRKVQIYADGADLVMMRQLHDKVDGFTTNPSLMKKAGVEDYKTFGRRALLAAGTKPVSLEVVADDLDGMLKQARVIATWGQNAVVKIPVTTTTGDHTGPIIKTLLSEGVKVNVTAVMTLNQILELQQWTISETFCIISVFAGRIADTGRDPVGTLKAASRHMVEIKNSAKLLWASPREVYNVIQAEHSGCHIITLQPDLIAKLGGLGADLNERSLDTIREFKRDAEGLEI